MVGNQTYKTFALLGIREVGLVQKMPLERMISVFGKNVKIIWERSNGIDDSPINFFTSEHLFLMNEPTEKILLIKK